MLSLGGPVTNSEHGGEHACQEVRPGIRCWVITPPLLPSEITIMSQFLLFVITVLLFAVFWELCKINDQLKRRLPSSPQISGRGHSDDSDTTKTAA